jgi:uncharacterized protein YjeT (DUF2065 family)
MGIGIYLGGCLAILGIFFIFFPLKTRESISSSSSTKIRFWGVLVIGIGVYLILLSCIYTMGLYMQPYLLKFINPNIKTMLSMEFILLRHFYLSSVFSIGASLILIGIIVFVSPLKVKRISEASSNVKTRLWGMLIIGFGIIIVLIHYVSNYFFYLQKQLMH